MPERNSGHHDTLYIKLFFHLPASPDEEMESSSSHIAKNSKRNATVRGLAGSAVTALCPPLGRCLPPTPGGTAPRGASHHGAAKRRAGLRFRLEAWDTGNSKDAKGTAQRQPFSRRGLAAGVQEKGQQDGQGPGLPGHAHQRRPEAASAPARGRLPLPGSRPGFRPASPDPLVRTAARDWWCGAERRIHFSGFWEGAAARFPGGGEAGPPWGQSSAGAGSGLGGRDEERGGKAPRVFHAPARLWAGGKSRNWSGLGGFWTEGRVWEFGRIYVIEWAGTGGKESERTQSSSRAARGPGTLRKWEV
ncbi:uncharacterized protein LOC117074070 [Trachypithecus francoisi]|uniref:uncharacterized protein LOC117074070 n=1 Tax=Trachypithecus francoisi TaxID=54180 RepID=UPI00141B6F3C|nr:uncharacterized protein LOC117074070 [Trachypithecus francoisi]